MTFVAATPEGDDLIAYMARVSNPQGQDNKETAPRLISYLIRNRHWSPFEMVNMTLEVVTTRDIGRQILRHRSFTFQEFSGRYAAYGELLPERMMRYQDTTNRQSSIIPDSDQLVDGTSQQSKDWEWWCNALDRLAAQAEAVYAEALNRGIAKECARAVLPEGLVPTRMYMNGTLRSWIHYIDERTQPGVQLEHRWLAQRAEILLTDHFPMVAQALELRDGHA
jgi:thymidylate synthase (FAD)